MRIFVLLVGEMLMDVCSIVMMGVLLVMKRGFVWEVVVKLGLFMMLIL